MRHVLVLSLLATGCGGSTGSALVTFSATASGASNISGAPVTFTNGIGAQVTLTRATLRIGAIYLNQSVPASGAASEPCVSPGIYVAQVFGPIDVDLLSPVAEPLPTEGEGTETEARTAEIWLTGGDVNATEDPTVILNVAGTAVQGAQTYPFTGAVTIGSNRKQAVTNPALPGANPICHQRIVTPILVDITPTNGGTLALQIDPRPMFSAVDFTTLTKISDAPLQYRIPDANIGAGQTLFKGMFASSGVYAFEWKAAPP
jgi:hypothetical protein